MALLKDLTVFGPSRLIGDAFGSNIYANKHITNGGTSSQFVKGDGTLDSNVYALNSALSGYVPTSRKVNGKALTADISLAISDILGSSTIGSTSQPIYYNGSSFAGITNNVVYTGTLVTDEIATWNNTTGTLKSSGTKISGLLTSVSGGALSSSGNNLSLTALSVTVGGTSKSNSASTSIPIINSLSVSTLSSSATTNLTVGITVNGKAQTNNTTLTDLYASYIQTSAGSTNADHYLTFVSTAVSTGQSLLTDTDIKYNPSTNTLTGVNTTFSGIGTFSGTLNVPTHNPDEATTTTGSFWLGEGEYAVDQGTGGGGGGGATLTIQQNGTTIITYNGSQAKTANIVTSWANLTNKPTTISGYGITDAKIVNNTITLGSNTITPITSHQTIKQDGVTGATVNRFGTCSVGAGTAAKTVSVTTGTYSLEAGAKVTVKFTYANTASNPTLNVGSTGAKNIYHKGSQITTGDNKALLAGTCDFVYDGTQYHLIGNYIDTNTHNSHGHTFTASAATGAAMSFGGTFTAVTALGNASATTGSLSSTYTNTTYTLPSLPTAAADVLGCVKVGTGLTITDGVLSVSGGGVSVDWSDISNTPTTVAGYGITDAVKTVSSTDNAIVRFDGTAGQIQNSVVTIADTTGNMHFGGSASNRLISYVATDGTFYPIYFNANGNAWFGAGLASNGTITAAKTTNITGHYIYFNFDKTTQVSGGQTQIRMYLSMMTPSEDNLVSLGAAGTRWKNLYLMDGYLSNQLHKYVDASTIYNYTLPDKSGTIALLSDIPTVPTLTTHAQLADTSTAGQAIVSKSGGYEWKTLGSLAYSSATIPTVYNATYSIKTKVGTAAAVTVSDFTANQSTDDDVTFIQGTNVTLTSDTTNRTITIAATDNDTKNTVGANDTSSKIFLVGVTSQTTGTGSAQSYSHDTAYVGTDGCLYSGNAKVLTAHQTLTTHAQLADTSTVGQAIVSKSGGYEWKTLGSLAYSSATIPTVNDAAFTIYTKANSSATAATLADFTANQSTADDVTFIAGTNVTFTNGTRTLTIAATDTKNTVGANDTSSKIFLVGVTSQTTGTNSAQSYSHDTAYVGTDGCLYSGGNKVLTSHQTLTTHAQLADTSTAGQALVSKSGGYEWKTLGSLAYSSATIPTVYDATFSVKTLVGSTTTTVADFTANQSTADDITFVAGANITLTPNASTRSITIASTGGSSGTVSSVTLNGQNYTASGGVVDLGMSSYNELIIGTHTAATNVMTGRSRLPSSTYFVSGYRFTFWNPYNGTSTAATLTLTFADNSTKTVNLYYKGNTRLTTHFGAGSKIDFVYLEGANVAGTSYTGCWPDCNYTDGNTTVTYGYNDYYSRWRLYSSSYPLYRYKLCGFRDNKIVPIVITNQTNDTQVNKVPADIGFDVTMGLAYYNSTTAITTTGAALGSQTIDRFRHITTCVYTFNTTVPVFCDVYLQGSFDGFKYFTLDNTQTSGNYRSYYVYADKGETAALAPSANYYANFTRGKYYWYVGSSYSTANYLQIEPNTPLYYYDGNQLIPVNPTWLCMQKGTIKPQAAAGDTSSVTSSGYVKAYTGDNILLGDSTFSYMNGHVVICTGNADRDDIGDNQNVYRDSDSIWHNYIRYNPDNSSIDPKGFVKSYKIWDAGNFNPRHYLKRSGNSSQPMTGSLWFNCTPSGTEQSTTKSIFWTTISGSDHTDFSAIGMSSNGTLTVGAHTSEATSSIQTPVNINTAIKGNVVYVNAGASDTANAWRFANYTYPSLDFYSSAESAWVQVLARSSEDGLNIGYDVLQYGNQTALMGGMVGVITGGDGIFLEDQVNVNGNIIPEDEGYSIGALNNRYSYVWADKTAVLQGGYYYDSANIKAVVHPISFGVSNTAASRTFAIKIPNISTETTYHFTVYSELGSPMTLGTYKIGFRTLATSGTAVSTNTSVSTTGNVSQRAAIGRDSNGNFYILLGSYSESRTYRGGIICLDRIEFVGLAHTAAGANTLRNHTWAMTELTSESTMSAITECTLLTNEQKKITISSSAPTSSDGVDGDIWLVI